MGCDSGGQYLMLEKCQWWFIKKDQQWLENWDPKSKLNSESVTQEKIENVINVKMLDMQMIIRRK